MKIVGIIAEYNPLHKGHAYQIAEAKRRSGADCCIAVMSTWAVQRGETACISVQERVKMALSAGVDAVFALPVLWSTQDAEHFALGGVALLRMLGANAISFGMESDDIDGLKRLAALLEEETLELQEALHAALDRGLPYPAALAEAAESVMPGSAALLADPNNTLALSYLRAMRRLHADMEVYPVHREGAYHAEELLEDVLPSASAVRRAIQENRWQDVQKAVPPECFAALQNAPIADMRRLDAVFLYALRGISEASLAVLPETGEGLENRLRSAAKATLSREELLQQLKTKRYPYARLSRLCLHALLGLTKEDGKLLPEKAWLLGFRDSALPYLQGAKSAGIPICSRATDFVPEERWLEIEQMAFELFCLAAGQRSGSVLSHKVVRME